MNFFSLNVNSILLASLIIIQIILSAFGEQRDICQDNFQCTKVGYFEDAKDCQKFYRCVDYWGDGRVFTAYHFSCGPGTIYAEANNACNHPWSVSTEITCRVCNGANQWGKEGVFSNGNVEPGMP